MTNGDKIRQMSNEELAEFMGKHIVACDICTYEDLDKCRKNACKSGIKAYLDMEVTENV